MNNTIPIYGLLIDPTQISDFPTNPNFTLLANLRISHNIVAIVRNSPDSVYVIALDTSWVSLEKRSLDLTQLIQTYPDYYFTKVVKPTLHHFMLGDTLWIIGLYSGEGGSSEGAFVLLFDGISFK